MNNKNFIAGLVFLVVIGVFAIYTVTYKKGNEKMNMTNEVQNKLTDKLIGRTYEYIYSSGMSVHLNFSENKANWKITEGKDKGLSDSNDYVARIVEEGVFFVRWHEPILKITVTLLINEPTNKIYGSVVAPNELEFDVAEILKM